MKFKLCFILLTLCLFILLTSCGIVQSYSNESSNLHLNNDESDSSNGVEKLEIFSWWIGAGEEDGLKALIDLFREKHPEIIIENAAIAGGAGTNAKAVLASRMQMNNPPATFQVHGGAELNESWVAVGKMEPLNDLYEAEGWGDKFPPGLIDMVSKDGKIYSVPVNIHRSNVLWYNKHIFEEHKLDPPSTFAEFFVVADVLQEVGVTPLALGDREAWTATHIFETVLLGELGADRYSQLWTGKLSFNEPEVISAMETFKKMLNYINSDHSSRNWQEASELVANGEAAMNIMGDWAKAYFVNDAGLLVNEDFGYKPTPNTEGLFMVVTDTFGLPKDVSNPDTVKKFLSVLGSVDGQDAFNPLKGSIPARIDADLSNYDQYAIDTMKDFNNGKLAPSLTHGSAASEGYLRKVSQAIHIFMYEKDIQQLIEDLEAAADEL